MCVKEREREIVCVCVCVCERKRERNSKKKSDKVLQCATMVSGIQTTSIVRLEPGHALCSGRLRSDVELFESLVEGDLITGEV